MQSTNIKNICLEKKLYTLPGNTTQDRMLAEQFYSDVYESAYDRVYKLLVNEIVTDITDEDRRVIIGMTITLFYRNPFWFDFYNKWMGNMFDRAYQMTVANNKESFFWNDEEISIKGKTVEEIKKHTMKELNLF